MEISPELVEACRRGDEEAFERLVRESQRSVYSLAYRIVGNHEDASDVAQEVYVKVWRSIRHFRGDAAFTSWLYRIASNAAIEHLRRRGRLADPVEPAVLAETAPAVVDEPDLGPGEVEEALARLPAPSRAALVMRELYGMSIEEIAQQMGTTTGAMKVRLHRARLRLAAEMSRPAPEAPDGAGSVVPLRPRERRSG